MNKLQTPEAELQRWTSASAEQVATLAGMQELTDTTYARSMVEANEGDGRMKTVTEAQLITLKGDIASLGMAAPQAAIIHGSSRPAAGAG